MHSVPLLLQTSDRLALSNSRLPGDVFISKMSGECIWYFSCNLIPLVSTLQSHRYTCRFTNRRAVSSAQEAGVLVEWSRDSSKSQWHSERICHLSCCKACPSVHSSEEICTYSGQQSYSSSIAEKTFQHFALSESSSPFQVWFSCRRAGSRSCRTAQWKQLGVVGYEKVTMWNQSAVREDHWNRNYRNFEQKTSRAVVLFCRYLNAKRKSCMQLKSLNW